MKKLYRFLSSISDFLQKPAEFISAIILFTGAMSLFLQVINRYILVKIFDFSFTFTEELSRYTIIWFTYIIAGVCLKEGELVSLNLLYSKLSKIPKLILYFFTRALMLLFVVVIIKYIAVYLPTAMKFRSVAMGIPGAFLYSFPGIGCVLLGYEIITEVCGVASGELQPFCEGRKPYTDGSDIDMI